jgi:transglutaminase-like putative cysteine protease
MKIVRLKLLLLVLTISSVSFSQNYELGKVTVEELQQTVHPTDSSASAAILFKKGDTKFTLNNSGWTITTEISFKIKVYKKEGISFADQQFAYYVGSSGRENMFFHDAYTYNLVDGKIEKTKLKNESEFKEEYNEEWNVKKLSFPQVKEGSIIEFSYRKTSPHIAVFDDFYFQKEIPIDYVEYSIYMPEYFKYRTVINGYEKINVKDLLISTGDFPLRKFTYSGKNIPAMKDEDFTINKENYMSILKAELASIVYPNQPIKNVAIDWNDVVKNIYQSDNFGAQLDENSYFKNELDELFKNLSTSQEKIVGIFNYVKSKMTWNEKYGIYTKDGVRKAYKDGIGNVAEINLMLTSMLRYAGFEANPILISTRANGISLFPNRSAFNYVVAAVEVTDALIFLDATNVYNTVNQLPIKALNWKGRIIRKHGSSAEVDLLNVPFSKENVTVMATINNDGVLEGKLRRQFTDYYAYLHRTKYGSVKEDSYLERLEKSFNDMDIEEYKVDNLKNISLPITESFTFKDDNSVEIIGDKMYVSPFFFFSQSTNPFNSETRTYPVDFNFPFKDSYNFSIKIPEGYEVEFLPSPIQLGMIKDYGIFKFNVSNNGNQIQVVSNFDINTFKVSAEDYLILKEFYKVMLGKHAEKIILKKKS